MSDNIKERLMNSVIYLLFSLLFVALSRAWLIRDLFVSNLGQLSFNLFIGLKLATLVCISGIFIINLYSFSLFKGLRQLMFSFIFLILLIIVALSLVVSVNDSLPVTLLYRPELQGILLFFLLVIMGLLFLKLVILRRPIQVDVPMRRVPFLLIGLVLILIAGYFWFAKEPRLLRDIAIALLYILLFSNLIGYLVKYLSDGSSITGNILFVLILGSTTLFFKQTDVFSAGYEGVLESSFNLVALVYLLNSFYRELFTSYLVEVEDLNEQRELYTENLKEVVEDRTLELQKANEQLESEIDAARRLQQSLLPMKDIVYSKASFISENFPCERLSGDFYDIYSIDEDKVGMYILDVSGHGINAALMNIYIYNYIRTTSPLIKRLRGDQPHENLRYLYDEFNKMNFPDHMHVVIFIASYDMKTGILSYASGGINVLPILARQSGGIEVLNGSSGFPICKMADYFTPEYFSAQVQLYSGDRVFFYTDGLLDERQGLDLNDDDLKILLVETLDEPMIAVDRALKKLLEPVKDDLVDDISYFLLEAK